MFNKKYFYMLLILCLITSDTLMRNIIRGVYGTAPFSRWSYSEFIAVTTPFLLIILIFLCISIFNERENTVKKIIFSTAFPQRKYYFLKAFSIGFVFIITALIPIIISFIYYKVMFGYTQFTRFIYPIILFLLPPFIFVLGLSMFLGKINVKLLYFLMPILFFTCVFNFMFPVWVDLCGNNFILDHGLSLSFSDGVMPYDITTNMIYSRLIFVFIGIILLLYSAIKSDTMD